MLSAPQIQSIWKYLNSSWSLWLLALQVQHTRSVRYGRSTVPIAPISRSLGGAVWPGSRPKCVTWWSFQSVALPAVRVWPSRRSDRSPSWWRGSLIAPTDCSSYRFGLHDVSPGCDCSDLLWSIRLLHYSNCSDQSTRSIFPIAPLLNLLWSIRSPYRSNRSISQTALLLVWIEPAYCSPLVVSQPLSSWCKSSIHASALAPVPAGVFSAV